MGDHGKIGPVRGELKFNSTTTDADEQDNKFRLAKHILYNMDTTNNTQKDQDEKEWVNTVNNYKNYLADWNGDNNIDAQDLSELCHKGHFGDGSGAANIPKPWAPTGVTRGGDKKLTATDSAATNRKVTLTFAYDLDNNSSATPDHYEIHRNDNGVKVDGAVEAVRHLGTNDTKTKTFEITLNNDSNWASSDNQYYVKHTKKNGDLQFDDPADPIYNFDTQAHTFQIDASTFNPKATISVFDDDRTNAGRNQINNDASINPNMIFIEIVFNRKVKNFSRNHIQIKDGDDNDITTLDSNFTTGGDDMNYYLKVPNTELTNGKEHTIKVLNTVGDSSLVSKKMNTLQAVDSDAFSFTFDSTTPTIDSAVIDNTGKTVTLTMSENVVLNEANVGDHKTEFKIAGQGPNSLARGTGNNTLVFTIPTAITNDVQSLTVNYTANKLGNITDDAGNSLADGQTTLTTAGSKLTNNSGVVATYELSYGDTTTTNADDLDMHIIYDGDTGILSVKKWKSLGVKAAIMRFQNATSQDKLFNLFTYTGSDTTIADTIKTYDAFGRGKSGFTKDYDIEKVALGFSAPNILQFGQGPLPGNADRNNITDTNTDFYIGEKGALPLFIIADAAPVPNDRSLNFMTTNGTPSEIATKQGNAWKPSKAKLNGVFAVNGFKLLFGGYDIGSEGAFDQDGTSKKARIEFKNLAA